VENTFSALSTVVPSHLMDRALFPFAEIKADGVANPLGDIAFDEEPCSTTTSVPGVIPLQAAADQ
jgi:tRNA 2-thiocytidine biosynthesis protein TtcA